MFPFQQGDALSSQIFSNPFQEDIIQENLILDQASLDGSNFTNLVGEGLPHKILPSSSTNDANAASDEKKNMRKEIERQRRHQIATLHASLRSLLPLESIRGKRSMTDQLNAAVNYIKQLQGKIEELSVKRDLLRKLSDSSSSTLEHGNVSPTNSSLNYVTVCSKLAGGIEIIISSGGYEEEGFFLSRVLKSLLEENFDVTSYVYTKRDERIYTTIHCEATNLTCIDESGLQQKLNDVISSSKHSSE